MDASEFVFVDTSAWFDYFIANQKHTEALRPLIELNAGALRTTDHIVCELFNLIDARIQNAKCESIWQWLNNSTYTTILSTSRVDLTAAFTIYSKFFDKRWSFTDCLSYHFIRTLKIPTALSLDRHFREFGVVSVLP